MADLDIDPAAMEAAVEAAVRTFSCHCDMCRRLMRRCFEAALPHILAAATCPCQTVAAELDWTQIQDACGVEDD